MPHPYPRVPRVPGLRLWVPVLMDLVPRYEVLMYLRSSPPGTCTEKVANHRAERYSCLCGAPFATHKVHRSPSCTNLLTLWYGVVRLSGDGAAIGMQRETSSKNQIHFDGLPPAITFQVYHALALPSAQQNDNRSGCDTACCTQATVVL